MRFDQGSWRKLYVGESVTHRMLPLFSRGLRDYLLRHAEEDGTILHESDDHAADLARILLATNTERKQLASALDDLLRIGYLATNGKRLWIAKFVEAQATRTPGAKRQAEWRIRTAGEVDTGDGQESVTGDAAETEEERSGDVSRNGHKNRQIEESRQIREVFDFWRETHGHPGAVLDAKRIARIRARLREGFTAEGLKLAVANAKKDSFLMGKNDRNRVFDGVETLLKDAAMVERLMGNGAGAGKADVIEVR